MLSRTFALSLRLQGWYRHWTFRVNPELKMVHLQSWFWIHPLLQKLHQFSRIVGLRTHYCTPVGELVRCVPAAKETISNILHWETAVAVIRNSFGNPTVYVGPNHHSCFSLERELDALLHTRLYRTKLIASTYTPSRTRCHWSHLQMKCCLICTEGYG